MSAAAERDGALARRDPVLLTPGPLTTSATVKQAMLHDWGSRDGAFIAMTRRVCDRLAALAEGAGSHACVPLQGSGTFAVEAMIGTLVPPAGKLLVLVNGAYGRRILRICQVLRLPAVARDWPEDAAVDPAAVAGALADDPAITHVALVQCETTSGVLNPLEAVAAAVAQAGRALLVDAMSAFGALPIDLRRIPCDAVAASSNKCLEGVPGIGFVLARRSVLEGCRGNARSLSLDLFEQWQGLMQNGQWRFTPPTHVLAALDQALREHEQEGGVAGRGARYRDNCRRLIDGMRALGFATLLPEALQAPIIVTFRMPGHPRFAFDAFYDRLRQRGYVIYPGKLTVADSFRVGCIGRIGEGEMQGAVAAVAAVLHELGVPSGAPADASATTS